MSNGTLPTIDWTNPDPCAVLAQLLPAYYALMSGAATVRIRISTAAGEREVQFAPANMDMLQASISRLQAACTAQQGLPSQRRAIRAGNMFPWGGPWPYY
jgi:hypothetical protein